MGKKIIISIISVFVILYCVLIFIVQPTAEKSLNKVKDHKPYAISPEVQKLHDNLIIADWHSDSLLWARDLTKRSDYGHMDIPRLIEGNVAVQMFTAVTKSPKGQNYKKNTGEFDNITLLATLQLWPIATWTSLTERALYQAEKLHDFSDDTPEQLVVVKSRKELKEALAKRKAQKEKGKKGTVIGLLGIEGLHALDGKFENIEKLYDAGYRMMGFHHFFDNKLGGSLHGVSREGLTDFGRKAVRRLNELSVIIDVAHSSPAVVNDILEISTKPLVVSHTGVSGAFKSPRNISDSLMKKIAEKGGIIAIGYWDAAIGNISPGNLVKTIRYAIDLVGEDHVSLGSDFDGSTEVAFDTSEISVITQEMVKSGFSQNEISKVMGLNEVNFLIKNLP